MIHSTQRIATGSSASISHMVPEIAVIPEGSADPLNRPLLIVRQWVCRKFAMHVAARSKNFRERYACGADVLCGSEHCGQICSSALRFARSLTLSKLQSVATL
jgi:hypothetical protein